MADRTNAKLFGDLFKTLSINTTEESKALGEKIYQLSKEYDFSPSQMEADESLLLLGLAKKGVHPVYPTDGVVMIYREDGEI